MSRINLTRTMGIAVALILSVSSSAHATPRDDAHEVAVAMAAAGFAEKAAEFEALVNGMSEADLQILADAGLAEIAASFNRYLATNPEVVGGIAERQSRSTLPDASYPSTTPCTSSNRSDDAVTYPLFLSLKIARAVVETANAALDAAQYACLLDVVVIGVGGNPQAVACIALEIILAVAEGVVGGFEVALETILFCDGNIDSSEIQGTYTRVEHLHGDLDTHDDDIKALLATHDADIKALLAAHDANITNLLAQHDADIKALLAIIGGQLVALQDDVSLIKKTQAEVAMDRRNKTHPSVFYEERLDEICDLAQEAINDLPVVYLLHGSAQELYDRAIQFKVTNPKRAAEECIRVFDLVTNRSSGIQ